MVKHLPLFLLLASVSLAQTWEVKGGSIQEKVGKAKTGDTVLVFPGEYYEAVTIETPGIKLQGKVVDGKWPVLDGKAKLNDGITALANGIEVSHFVVKNFKGNGVVSLGVDEIYFHHLFVEKTGLYGIYPTRGTHVVVEDTVTTGITDAGIYIGMCTHTEVRRNEVYGNVGGIEIENSSDVIVEDNFAHHNTAGILVFTLPGLPVKSSRNTIVRRNIVAYNNLDNFGPTGSVVAQAPKGSGIIVLAGDTVTIESNTIHHNDTGGIIFADLEFIKDNASPDPAVKPTFDNNRILENFLFENGKNPLGKIRLLLAALHFSWNSGDLIVHGKGTGNCLHPNFSGSRIGAGDFKECDAKLSSKSILTVLDKNALKTSFSSRPMPKGERIYNISCAGCHGLGTQVIGPRIEELQNKYAGNPKGMTDFAMSPVKVRGSAFPQMPSQALLGREQIQAAAEYMLSLKGKRP